MVQANNIGNRLLRSQRYVVVFIIAMFTILMVITAAAGRGYVDKDVVTSSLSNTYNNLWGDASNDPPVDVSGSKEEVSEDKISLEDEQNSAEKGLESGSETKDSGKEDS